MSYYKDIRDITLIAKKDLISSLNSPILYSITSVYLFLSGFFFFSYLKVFNPLQKIATFSEKEALSLNSSVIIPLLDAQVVLIMLIVPLITAKSFYDERKNGTMELLLTLSISEFSIVLGKWLSVIYQILIMILLGSLFPISLCIISDPEILPVVLGLLGLALISITISSLGIMFSIVSNSFVTSSALTLFVTLSWFMLDIPFDNLDLTFSYLIEDFTLSKHSSLLTRGIYSLLSIYILIFFNYLTTYISISKLSNRVNIETA